MKNKIILIGIILFAGLAVSSFSLFKPSQQEYIGGTVLKVPNGGTGTTTFPAGECLKGNGTGAITSGLCSTAVETDPIFIAASTSLSYVKTESDPVWMAASSSYVLTSATSTWNTAYADRLKWDGGATDLVAATGRTSLGLGSMALLDNTGSTTITTLGSLTSLTVTGTTTISGKVGIGTINPATTLDIADLSPVLQIDASASSSGTSILQLKADRASAGGTANQIKFFNNGATPIAAISAIRGSSDTTGSLILGTSNATAMTIDSSGNVGVATSTMTGVFNVAGKIWSTIAQFITQLFIPVSSSLVTNTSGEIGIDSTSGQLRYNDGTATRTLTYFTTPTVTLASTTLTGDTATTTIPLGYATANETWSSVICGTDTGTSTLRFGDGTNYTNVITATSTPYPTTLSSNNAFTANEKRQIQIMTTVGSPNYISCTVKKTWDND